MVPPTPPMPGADALTEPFWAGARAGSLVIQRCRHCGLYVHLPRPVCRRCLSFDLGHEAVTGRGTVYSYTETHKAFHPFFVDRVPYLVAAIELEQQPGLRLLSNLVRVTEPDVRFGMAVVVEFEQRSPELTIPVFAPEAGAASLPGAGWPSSVSATQRSAVTPASPNGTMPPRRRSRRSTTPGSARPMSTA